MELDPSLKDQIESAFEELFLAAMSKALGKLQALVRGEPERVVEVVSAHTVSDLEAARKEAARLGHELEDTRSKMAAVEAEVKRVKGHYAELEQCNQANLALLKHVCEKVAEFERKETDARIAARAAEALPNVASVTLDAEPHQSRIHFEDQSSIPADEIASGDRLPEATEKRPGETFAQCFLRIKAEKAATPLGGVYPKPDLPPAEPEKPKAKRTHKGKAPKEQPSLMPEVVEELEADPDDLPEPEPLVMEAIISEAEIASLGEGFADAQAATAKNAADRAQEIALAFQHGSTLILRGKASGKTFTYKLEADGRVLENGEEIEADESSALYWRFVHRLRGENPTLDDRADYSIEDLF